MRYQAMTKLTHPQIAQLMRIDAGGMHGMPAAGFTASAPEKRLLARGLIHAWTTSVPAGIGALTIKLSLAAVTNDGHRLFADLGLPPSADMARFIGRRQGWCSTDYELLRVAHLRGYVEPVERGGIGGCTTRWRRTDAGKDALILFHEHERMVAEQMAKLEVEHLARSKTQATEKPRTRG